MLSTVNHWREAILRDIDIHRTMPRPKHDLRNGKKNVLIMTQKLNHGGAERVACNIASGLADSCNVTIMYEYDGVNRYDIDPRVQIIRWPKMRVNIFKLQQICYMRRLKRRFHTDVSLSLLYRMNLRNVLTKGKERVIVSERNNPKLREPENFNKIRWIYALADHVVFQTREVQSMFGRRTQAHSSILPNPVSIACLATDVRKPRIVNVARLNASKNQAMLIRAFARFLPTHPEYVLELYGAGDLEAQLKALVQELGLQDKVIFHGNVKNLHEQIADAGMFILSSNFEGMPNALLEAMMMGLPCISTNCTGAKEVIHDKENGLLTQVGDEQGMAEAMAYMAEHPEFAERSRHKARETAQAFRMEDVMKQWLALIRD